MAGLPTDRFDGDGTDPARIADAGAGAQTKTPDSLRCRAF
jgi:hypothetical protein